MAQGSWLMAKGPRGAEGAPLVPGLGPARPQALGPGRPPWPQAISHEPWTMSLEPRTINHRRAIYQLINSSFINHQSSIINHQTSTTNHQSSITNHQSSVINHQSPIIKPQSWIINHQSSTINPKSYVTVESSKSVSFKRLKVRNFNNVQLWIVSWRYIEND